MIITRYALKDKHKFAFRCIAETEAEFDNKIQSAYFNARGLSTKGEQYTLDDFLSRYDKVKVIVEYLK